MDLVSIAVSLVVLALIGFMVYIVITYIPMPELFKQLIMVVVAVLVILYVLGLITGHAAPITLGGYRRP